MAALRGRTHGAVRINSLYFYTVLRQTQALFTKSLSREKPQGLESLEFYRNSRQNLGFSLPTLVLTPGWAIC
jgi:hypothetical protein